MTIAEEIAAMGFQVYQRSGSDSYCYYTDGKHIGYAQYDRVSGYHIGSVHKLNRDSGTGFVIAQGEPISKDLLRIAMTTVAPHWASSKSVVKYDDWDSFHNKDDWNKELKLYRPE